MFLKKQFLVGGKKKTVYDYLLIKWMTKSVLKEKSQLSDGSEADDFLCAWF
jgi:hypothetical protein